MPDHRAFHSVPPDVAEARRLERAAQREREQRESAERVQVARRSALAIAGGLFMLAGLYFLLVAPGEAVSGVGAIFGRSDDTMRVANLHRLTLGETFTITGAILSGFAWRPKA
jgi:hypothetical protein